MTPEIRCPSGRYAMTERMLAQEALERKENREKWEFLRLEVRRLVEGSEELGALAAALPAGDEDFVAFEGGGTLVGERLKCNGMRWSVAGANDIMALRCCIRNRRYDHFWRHRNKQAA